MSQEGSHQSFSSVGVQAYEVGYQEQLQNNHEDQSWNSDKALMVEGSDANRCGQQGVSTKAVELHQLTMYHGEALTASE